MNHLRTRVSYHVLQNFVWISRYQIIQYLCNIPTHDIVWFSSPKILNKPSYCTPSSSIFVFVEHKLINFWRRSWEDLGCNHWNFIGSHFVVLRANKHDVINHFLHSLLCEKCKERRVILFKPIDCEILL